MKKFIFKIVGSIVTIVLTSAHLIKNNSEIVKYCPIAKGKN